MISPGAYQDTDYSFDIPLDCKTGYLEMDKTMRAEFCNSYLIFNLFIWILNIFFN